MRQLRDYEKKLRAKRSHPNVHKIGDPLVAGMPMPDLIYGSDESEDNPDELSSVGEIKPRPKPRIPKFKPAEVRLCCAEIFSVETAIHELPSDPSEMPPSKKLRRSRRTGVATSHTTAAAATTTSKFQTVHATLCIAECSSVAEVRSETPLVDHGIIGAAPSAATTTTTPTWSPSSSFKKRLPFTKISEPAKIAVSFFVLPLCCSSTCLSLDSPQQLQLQTSSNSGISVFAADTNGQLAQVTEEVILECAVSGLAKAVTQDSVSDRAALTRVTLEANITVVTQTLEIFECPGVYRYQQLSDLAVLPNKTATVATNDLPMLPKAAPNRLQRNTATRMSIKVTGLNIWPAPEKHQKRPQFIDPDYFGVASCQLPAVLFEKATANIGRFRAKDNSAGATVVLYSPAFMAPASKEPIVLECCNVFVKQMNLALVSAVPSRRLLMTSNAVAISKQPLELWNQRELPIFVLPSREYPYYTRVPRQASEAVEKVKFSATVEATWFFPLKARPSTKAVPLAKSETAACRLIERLPALEWAAERSEFDVDTQWRETRPLVIDSKEWQVASRLKNSVIRLTAVTEEVFNGESTNGLAKYSPPEAYNSWSVMRMCAHPLYGIAVNESPTVLVMNNTYCEPRPFTVTAKCIQNSRKRFEGTVAQKSEIRVCLDSVELVDIPYVVGDIQDIRTKLVNQNDPVKVSIWLEIFKRSVLKARPVHPFVVLTETLPVAAVSRNEVFFEFAGAIPMRDIIETNIIVDRSFLATAKPVLFHAVIVSHAAGLDNFNLETAELFSGRKVVLPPMQKASEIRDYILDYAVIRWNQPLESSVNSSAENSESFSSSKLVCNVQSLVVAPLGGVVSISQPVCEAEAGSFVKFSFNHLMRSPFSLVSRFLSVADFNQPQCLQHEADLPTYKFVQDVEEEASALVQDSGCRERLDKVLPPADVLWFFQVRFSY